MLCCIDEGFNVVQLFLRVKFCPLFDAISNMAYDKYIQMSE